MTEKFPLKQVIDHPTWAWPYPVEVILVAKCLYVRKVSANGAITFLLRVSAVRSVLTERGNDPYLATTSAEELGKLMSHGTESLLHKVLVPMARTIRIVRGNAVGKNVKINTSLFETKEEDILYQSVMAAKEQVCNWTGGDTIDGFIERV